MAKARLRLTLSIWDYDRTRALADGSVRPEGIELNVLELPVEETFFRMARYREFDVAEMSMSSYTVSLHRDPQPFIAIPVFPSRFFRHSCIYVSAKSGIREPKDLIGKRIGTPEYQMTAPVWIRGILSDDYGVKVTDVEHFSGGEEEPGRDEKLKLDLPSNIRLRPIPGDKTLSRMLAEGELDALVTARAPSTFHKEPDKVKRLFPNYVEVEKEYYRRTRIFPPMHTVVMRRDVYAKHPWVAQSLYKAFVEAKAKAYALYNQTAALPAMVPWLVAEIEEARREMGEDWWPYGLEPNRKALETFLRYHHEQGLSKRRFQPEELFARETLASFKV
ncbi:MAG TPA: ABC transporter substrate-binding protein [Burkholderiales bacterium]|nr:ABC transporter substrate-binding protein [Burkholderiales bacterium]